MKTPSDMGSRGSFYRSAAQSFTEDDYKEQRKALRRRQEANLELCKEADAYGDIFTFYPSNEVDDLEDCAAELERRLIMDRSYKPNESIDRERPSNSRPPVQHIGGDNHPSDVCFREALGSEANGTQRHSTSRKVGDPLASSIETRLGVASRDLPIVIVHPKAGREIKLHQRRAVSNESLVRSGCIDQGFEEDGVSQTAEPIPWNFDVDADNPEGFAPVPVIVDRVKAVEKRTSYLKAMTRELRRKSYGALIRNEARERNIRTMNKIEGSQFRTRCNSETATVLNGDGHCTRKSSRLGPSASASVASKDQPISFTIDKELRTNANRVMKISVRTASQSQANPPKGDDSGDQVQPPTWYLQYLDHCTDSAPVLSSQRAVSITLNASRPVISRDNLSNQGVDASTYPTNLPSPFLYYSEWKDDESCSDCTTEKDSTIFGPEAESRTNVQATLSQEVELGSRDKLADAAPRFLFAPDSRSADMDKPVPRLQINNMRQRSGLQFPSSARRDFVAPSETIEQTGSLANKTEDPSEDEQHVSQESSSHVRVQAAPIPDSVNHVNDDNSDSVRSETEDGMKNEYSDWRDSLNLLRPVKDGKHEGCSLRFPAKLVQERYANSKESKVPQEATLSKNQSDGESPRQREARISKIKDRINMNLPSKKTDALLFRTGITGAQMAGPGASSVLPPTDANKADEKVLEFLSQTITQKDGVRSMEGLQKCLRYARQNVLGTQAESLYKLKQVESIGSQEVDDANVADHMSTTQRTVKEGTRRKAKRTVKGNPESLRCLYKPRVDEIVKGAEGTTVRLHAQTSWRGAASKIAEDGSSKKLYEQAVILLRGSGQMTTALLRDSLHGRRLLQELDTLKKTSNIVKRGALETREKPEEAKASPRRSNDQRSLAEEAMDTAAEVLADTYKPSLASSQSRIDPTVKLEKAIASQERTVALVHALMSKSLRHTADDLEPKGKNTSDRKRIPKRIRSPIGQGTGTETTKGSHLRGGMLGGALKTSAKSKARLTPLRPGYKRVKRTKTPMRVHMGLDRQQAEVTMNATELLEKQQAIDSVWRALFTSSSKKGVLPRQVA